MSYYILNHDHSITQIDDITTWARSFEKSSEDKSRIVKQESVNDHFISTVFLGLDHGHILKRRDPDYKPVLFETMIFKEGSELDDYQDRCCTYEEAIKMHEKAVRLVKDMEICNAAHKE